MFPASAWRYLRWTSQSRSGSDCSHGNLPGQPQRQQSCDPLPALALSSPFCNAARVRPLLFWQRGRKYPWASWGSVRAAECTEDLEDKYYWLERWDLKPVSILIWRPDSIFWTPVLHDVYIGFPGGSVVKNLPASAGDTGDSVRPLDREDHLEKEMATCSNILAWEIPWTGVPGVHGVAKSQAHLSTEHIDMLPVKLVLVRKTRSFWWVLKTWSLELPLQLVISTT